MVRGYRPAGLLAYLFGPGRFEEHRNPRVVASWDGTPGLHQPEPLLSVVLSGEVVQPGEFDLDLRPLIRTMTQWPKLAGLPVGGLPPLPPAWARLLADGQPLPADAPGWARCYAFDPKAGAVVLRPGYVWHCPVRLHPDDPVLSDAQWQHIAQRLMRAVGIQEAGCRWIAVRHAEDHIHLMATLVSETTGKRFHPYRDYLRLRQECRRLESEYGLTSTAPADHTVRPAPTRAEQAIAARFGRQRTAREELRRRVAQCAAISSDGAAFLAQLRQEMLDPRTVQDPAGQVRGYTVAWPMGWSRTGERIRYSGKALAPDLTWPKLTARWASTPPVGPLPRNEHGRVTPTARHTVLAQTAALVDHATAVLRERVTETDGIVHATGELLTVLGRASEGHAPGVLVEVADRYDRAARTPYSVLQVSLSAVARELRHASRQLGAIGMLTGRGNEHLATTALLLALAGLVTEIAAWQQLRGRPHQAAAARATATGLAAVAQTSSERRPVGHPPYPTVRSDQPAAQPSYVDLGRPAAWRGAGTPDQQAAPHRRR